MLFLFTIKYLALLDFTVMMCIHPSVGMFYSAPHSFQQCHSSLSHPISLQMDPSRTQKQGTFQEESFVRIGIFEFCDNLSSRVLSRFELCHISSFCHNRHYCKYCQYCHYYHIGLKVGRFKLPFDT